MVSLPYINLKNGVLIDSRSIANADGPKIADSFYEHLFKDYNHTMSDAVGPDTTKAAWALYIAVAKLCSENASLCWVPFIHLGEMMNRRCTVKCFKEPIHTGQLLLDLCILRSLFLCVHFVLVLLYDGISHSFFTTHYVHVHKISQSASQYKFL